MMDIKSFTNWWGPGWWAGGVISSEKKSKAQYTYQNQILHNFHLIFFSTMDIKIFTYVWTGGCYLFRKIKSQEQYPY